MLAASAVAAVLFLVSAAATGDSCLHPLSKGSGQEDELARAASLEMLQRQLHMQGSEGAPTGRLLPEPMGSTRQWCGYDVHSGFFTAIIPPTPQTGFLLDLAASLRKTGVARFLVTAMTTSGTYSDSYGFLTEYAYPAEETSSTMYEFRMADDGVSVDVFQPSMRIRTSDTQSRVALARGLGSGWIANLPTYECSQGGHFLQVASGKEGRPTVRNNTAVKGPGTSLAQVPLPETVIVDGEQLLMQGFFVVNSVVGLPYRKLSVRTYPQNLDVKAEFVMAGGDLSLGFSLVWLRDEPMEARASDDRLLYFSTNFEDKGVHSERLREHPQDSVDRQVSHIWRYDLSQQPQQQIRVHVDPTVPKRWWPYFRKGIDAWNTAFALTGRPHAMHAVLPGDPDWPRDYDVSDARFSTISWVFTNAVVSMGIAKVDPRSGEIMKSDITMSDGWVKSWLGDLDLQLRNATHTTELSQGYRRESFAAKSGDRSLLELQQSSLTVPRADWGHGLSLLSKAAGAPLTSAQREKLLGEGLRSIVTHETGHILGLRHNFKGSMAISAACTRNLSCTQEHGLSASVMDYTPLNLPTQDTPNVDIFSPVLGAYDKLAIQYGYMDVPNSALAAEDATLVPELEQVLSKAEAIGSCHDGGAASDEDPGCKPYDLTDDPVSWFESQIHLLAGLQKTLLNASVLPGTPITRYGESVLKVLNLALTNTLDSASWLGGVHDAYAHRRVDGGLPKSARAPVPAEQQRRALKLVLRVLRPEQVGLLPPRENFRYLVQGDSEEVSTLNLEEKVHIIRSTLLKRVLSSSVFKRMHANEQLGSVAGDSSLGCGEFLGLLVDGVLGATLMDAPSSDWELHNILIERLGSLYADSRLPEEVTAHVLVHIRWIHREVQDELALVPEVVNGSAPLLEHLLSLRHQLQLAACPGGSAPECISLLKQDGVSSGGAHRLCYGCASVVVLLTAVLAAGGQAVR